MCALCDVVYRRISLKLSVLLPSLLLKSTVVVVILTGFAVIRDSLIIMAAQKQVGLAVALTGIKVAGTAQHSRAEKFHCRDIVFYGYDPEY